MAKKHKTFPVQPPKTDSNVLTINVPIIPQGHMGLPQKRIFAHCGTHRLKTRANQFKQATKDW
jgi:hypothetical protein